MTVQKKQAGVQKKTNSDKTNGLRATRSSSSSAKTLNKAPTKKSASRKQPINQHKGHEETHKNVDNNIFGIDYRSLPESAHEIYSNGIEAMQEMFNSENIANILHNSSSATEDTAGQSPFARSTNQRLMQTQELFKQCSNAMKTMMEKKVEEFNRCLSESTRNHAALYRDIMKSADEKDKLDSLYGYAMAQINNAKTHMENVVKDRYAALNVLLSLNNEHINGTAREAYNSFVNVNNSAQRPYHPTRSR